mgnify:CR=1 FL=1
MNFKYKKFFNHKEIIFLIFYCTILISFFLNEDSLGGAKHDFLAHYKYSQAFNDNFFQTFKNFGTTIQTRNSPIFWIIIGFLDKIFTLETIRLLNSLCSLLIAFFLYKCLLLKFKNQKKILLVFLSTIIFLSPTIRSLSIWPYSLIWGLLFFVISIYYFLKSKKITNSKMIFIMSIKALSFLILSSYIHPSFAVFSIYFFFHFFKKFKFSQKLYLLFIYSFLLSIPALYYIFDKQVLEQFTTSQGFGVEIGVNFSNSINLSNKIMIISTIFLFFILPVINWNQTLADLKKTNFKICILIFLFFMTNVYFFDYPYIDGGGFGGGFFHKFSNMFFYNNFVFYFVFIFSLFTIYSILVKNWNNYLLLILLVLLTPQFTIYNKYYDPLIYILFITLFELDMNKHYFKKKYKQVQLYSLSIGYLGIALFKNYLL